MTNPRLILSIFALLLLQLAFWQWGLSYEQLLTLSGYLAINFMSFTMLLATRPRWLEVPLGGLDKMYQLHKWTGILAVIFALSHWLIEMADDVLKALFGKDRSLREADFTGLLAALQEVAEDFGEPGLYLLLALVTITLLKWFPYRYWRYLHRLMPLIYLALATHALLLAPLSWWSQPTGWLMVLFMLGGVVAAIQSLTGLIGQSRRWQGIIQVVRQVSQNTIEVVCDMGKNWPGHKAGQFALVTFDAAEGAHPFTLSSADKRDGILHFQIKALGDYTRTLSQQLKNGRAVSIEGPYGCFNPAKGRAKAAQVWIAGGIGITPFLAAMESRLVNVDKKYPAVNLYYCTDLASNDPTVAQLNSLVERLPEITLQIYESQLGQWLTADKLTIHTAKVDIWFCGPQGLAATLRSGLQHHTSSICFYQERFEFR